MAADRRPIGLEQLRGLVAVEAGEIEDADGSLQIVLGQVNLENDKWPRHEFADSPLRVTHGIHTGH